MKNLKDMLEKWQKRRDELDSMIDELETLIAKAEGQKKLTD